MTMDYRPVNNETPYPLEALALPRIAEVQDRMLGSTCFTKIDLRKMYWQLTLAEESRPLTAFVTHFGQFQLKRVSMGLKNALQQAQRTLNKVLAGLEFCCDHHVDDIVVFSKTEADHLRDVDNVLQRLEDANILATWEKCDLFRHEVTWCGYCFSEHGTTVDPSKTEAVLSIPYPTTARGIQALTGLCNYYRKWIPEFASKSACLNKLTQSDAVWSFGVSEKRAWDQLKRDLCSAPYCWHKVFWKVMLYDSQDISTIRHSSGYLIVVVWSPALARSLHTKFLRTALLSVSIQNFELHYVQCFQHYSTPLHDLEALDARDFASRCGASNAAKIRKTGFIGESWTSNSECSDLIML